MLTVKQLQELGYTEEQAKQIIELEKKDIDGNYEPKERNQQLREQVKQLQADVKSRDEQITELGKSAGASEELKKQVKQLQEDNKQKDVETEKKMAALQKEYAVRSELSGKVHDVDVALGLIDLDKITLSESGAVKSGFKEQFETLTKEKSYLIVKDGTPRVKTGIKPFGTGVPTGGEGGHDEDPKGVSYAKAAAQRKKDAVASSKKAADAYFGNH